MWHVVYDVLKWFYPSKFKSCLLLISIFWLWKNGVELYSLWDLMWQAGTNEEPENNPSFLEQISWSTHKVYNGLEKTVSTRKYYEHKKEARSVNFTRVKRGSWLTNCPCEFLKNAMHVLLRWFDAYWKSVRLWIGFSKNHSDYSSEFFQFQVWYGWEADHYKP